MSINPRRPAVRERPILFSAPMVRAILSNTKTQTRRIGKTQCAEWTELAVEYSLHAKKGKVAVATHLAYPNGSARHGICECPYGIPELAGQAHARDGGDGREAPRSEVHGCGTGTYPLGNQQGLVQPAARGACAGCGAVVDSGHRIGGDRLYVRETWAAPHAYDHLPPRLIPQDARIHYAATEDRGGLLWRPSIHMPRWASRITLEVTNLRVERLQDISAADALAEGVNVHRDFHDKPATSLYSPVQAYRDLWEQINGPGSWDANPWVWVVEFKRLP